MTIARKYQEIEREDGSAIIDAKLSFSITSAASSDLSRFLDFARAANVPVQEQLAAKIVNIGAHHMSDKVIKDVASLINTALEDYRNINANSAKELVMVSLAMLAAQYKDRIDFSISTSDLKRIQDNPEIPPEVRAVAEQTKDTVEYKRYLAVEKLFEEIKRIKQEETAKTAQTQSFKSA
ncbi:MAG: hypothetical protein ABIF01_01500 [Candidatus Micrarchaeota archaeon]